MSGFWHFCTTESRNVTILKFLYTSVQKCKDPDISVHLCAEMSGPWHFCSPLYRNVRIRSFLYTGVYKCQDRDILYTGVQECQDPDISVHRCAKMSRSWHFCTSVHRHVRILTFLSHGGEIFARRAETTVETSVLTIWPKSSVETGLPCNPTIRSKDGMTWYQKPLWVNNLAFQAFFWRWRQNPLGTNRKAPYWKRTCRIQLHHYKILHNHTNLLRIWQEDVIWLELFNRGRICSNSEKFVWLCRIL